MPAFLPKGRLIAYRVDLSGHSKADFQQSCSALEAVAEMVSVAPGQIVKVYWQFMEPIQAIVRLPEGCLVERWED